MIENNALFYFNTQLLNIKSILYELEQLKQLSQTPRMCKAL